MLDVSHDSEGGAHEHELRVQAGGEGRAEQGAHLDILDQVCARLGEQATSPTRRAGCIVVDHA